MGRSILITSGKGGVGKTTLTANLGLALARMNKKVCVVDMDLGLKNLDLALGLENRLLYDAKDVMEHRCSLKQALVQDKRCSSLYLLSVCRTINLDKIVFENLKPLIDGLKKEFDVLLLDCPAGIEKGFQYSVQLCDEALCVIHLDIASLMDCDRVIGILLRNGIKKIQLVVNRINPQSIQRKMQCTLKEALDYLSLDCAGILYEDPLIQMGNNMGNGQMSDVSKECFDVLAKRLFNQDVSFPRYKEKSFLKKIFG